MAKGKRTKSAPLSEREARSKAIYEALVAGRTAGSIAEEYGISASAIRTAGLTYAARNGLVLEARAGREPRGEDMRQHGISLSGEEREKIQKAAAKAGKKFAAFIREAALEAA